MKSLSVFFLIAIVSPAQAQTWCDPHDEFVRCRSNCQATYDPSKCNRNSDISSCFGNTMDKQNHCDQDCFSQYCSNQGTATGNKYKDDRARAH